MKVSIIQAAPVYYDLMGSLHKLEGLLAAAAAQASELVVFGECWLSGYPAWLDYCPGAALWNDSATKEVYAQMYTNSLVLGSSAERSLGALCQQYGVWMVIGVNEAVEQGPGQGTLYNSLLTYGPDGERYQHHRKLMPTYTEKLVYGLGEGDGLSSIQMPQAKLGSLICWEHWMPLTRQVMHDSGEDLHVAVWPTVHDLHQLASRHYAFEGKCFVLAAGQLLQVKDLPATLQLPDELATQPEHYLLRGGSGIIGPDSNWLVEPVFEKEEIVSAELDLTILPGERMYLDVSGHYQRPDVFDFRLKNQKNP
ncbi:MAG: carbon-nitrogen hydrolase family protein [Bacteroidota bacterium]